MDFQKINDEIAPPSQEAMTAAWARWDSIAKPLRGLGVLEEHIVKIAGLTGRADVCLYDRKVIVLCADNGVVAEGVTQSDASVTAVVAEQIAKHRSSVCRMASCANAEVLAVDVGMLRRVPGVRDLHIADGTGNIAEGPAMTPSEACRGIQLGIELVREQKEAGCDLLVTGEMGIGNTTTAAAVASVLLGLPVETAAGRGAGLSDEGLARKCSAICRAIEINQPDPKDALDVLAKLGGFDIAAMVGLYIGGALYRIPILIDGVISAAAALVAAKLCPNSRCAMLATHTSAEPAARELLNTLELKAVISAELKLGEGTGAVCLLPLLDMALSVYHSSNAFADWGLEPYTPQNGDNR